MRLTVQSTTIFIRENHGRLDIVTYVANLYMTETVREIPMALCIMIARRPRTNTRRIAMANIYELTEQIKALQAAYENGEIPEDAFNDTLEGLKLELPELIENICKWRADVLADIAGYKAEINRLSERK